MAPAAPEPTLAQRRAVFRAAVARLPASGFAAQAMHLQDVDYFCDPSADAHVAYWPGRRLWLAAGPPVAEAPVQVAAVHAFVAAARARGARAAFFALPQGLAEAAGLQWVAFGEDPVCFRSGWTAPENAARTGFRRQVRRGLRTLTVTACTSGDVKDDLVAVARAWQARQAMPALHFLASLRIRSHDNVRCWAARSARGVEGLAIVVGQGSRCTFLIEHVLRRPDAPNGTAEALIDAVMRELDEAERVSLGFVALSGPVARPLRWAAWWGQALYSFAGLAAFRRRLQPDEITVLGLAYPTSRDAPFAAWGVAMAFIGSRPILFAVRFVLRGAPLVLWLQGAALVPWTLALAMAPTSPWFVHPSTQRAWTVFDALLALALCVLAWRPRYGLALALAALVSMDVVITSAEALCAGPTHGLRQALIRAAMLLAPAMSACVLWLTARRLRRLR